MKKHENCLRPGILIVMLVFCVMMAPVFAAAKENITLKLACQNLPPVDTQSQTVKKFSELVKERTGGRIDIKIYPGTIADGPALLSTAQEGVADFMVVVTAFISARVRALAPIDYLGAYPSEKKFLKVADSIKPVMSKIFKKEGLTYLGASYSFSGWIFASTDKNLLTLSDFKGQKLRVPGMWLNKQHKTFGVSPIMILPPELYPSLQRGVIDGVCTIASLIVGFKLYEPAPFVTELLDTSGSLVVMTANTEKFSRLSAADQALIRKAAIDAEKFSYDYGLNLEIKMRGMLKAKSKYVAFSEEQKKTLLDARGNLKAELLDYAGPLGVELMNVFQSIN